MGVAEWNYIAEADDLFDDDPRPRSMIINDELAMMMGRIVGGVGEQPPPPTADGT